MSGLSLRFCNISSSLRQTALMCEDTSITDIAASFMLTISVCLCLISSPKANCSSPLSEDFGVYISVKCYGILWKSRDYAFVKEVTVWLVG